MKDLFKKEIKVGDKVVYVSKSYGSMALNSATLWYGYVSKVTEKTVSISVAIKKNGKIVMKKEQSYPTKIVADYNDQTHCVVIINKFPKEFIDQIKEEN